ncbi:GDSL-type esterase/lipase family protein [Piscinibacter koreensis]|uniref:SGNH/GDSL hydrolase family protein n=1 Tax=Piscinibacter koreensis TaxID=2742824 RepID=A0A7Y6NPR3_9BURK|nr:GDSL-type esterase/lipase family protein [Schlegelella koreensis]NUZ07081.1 SGNH/GDSL hydrolase family protein [Schlegelella koreensis]
MKFTGSKGSGQPGQTWGLFGFDVLRRRLVQGATACVAALAIALPMGAAAQLRDGSEVDTVATWSAPIVSANPATGNRVNNQTLRQIAHISIGGTRVRVRLTNRWNPQPLTIGGAQVALRTTDNGIDGSTSRPLTFSGSSSIVIPPFSEMLSDWVDLTVPDLVDMAVDLYIPGDTSATGNVLSVFSGARQTNYLSQEGNFVGSTAFPQAGTRTIWQFLASIDVVAPGNRGAIVALGDSITEGFGMVTNSNGRWPDVLARRLLPANRLGIANVGISGNRVSVGAGSTNPSALARFDADVIARTGAKYVIVLLGINDANGGTSGEDIISALRQVAIRARAQQMKIFIATITPFGRATDVVEARRILINNWIRTTRETDGYVDFDAVIRDPANPRMMRNDLQSGDQLHPNNAGYEVMGNAIDLSLFN